MSKFHGAWPALATPFTAHNEVNTPVLTAFTRYLIGKGVDGFYVAGSTGEGIYMSVEERQRVAETVVTEARGKVPVIVHVGTMVVRDAVTLSQHAAAIKADGIASIIPANFTNLDSVYDYYVALSQAAPDVPLFCYLLNPNFDAVALMRRLKPIANLSGAKYTGPNMVEMRQIIDLGAGQWTIFSGMDEQCLYARMNGADGCIGSTLNYMPGVYKAIYRMLETGAFSLAQDLQYRANRTTLAMIDINYWGAMKDVISRLGFDYGQPRLPARPLTAAQRDSLWQALEALNFGEFTAM